MISFIISLNLACEEVIEVDVPSEEPRLIINALVRVDPDSTFVNLRVKVGLTDSFFGEIPVTNLKQITLGGAILVDIDNPGSGIYENVRTRQFFEERAEIGDEILLQIDWEDKLYYASTMYVETVPIDTLEIGTNTLFNDDDTELIITITDDPDKKNYYIFDLGFGEFATLDDEFIQGQQFSFSYFYDRQFEPGEELTISVLGADQSFYNYMDLLIEQTEDNLGVFETPAATVRGNIFDVTELDNIDFFDNVKIPNEFPLGYFAVVQEYKRTIIIE
ncbi:DUF4249 domain-containing protein [Flagellimonas meishanensis]|uniref:DUF4249 domain-containing protein n=1 Tax=Flagellimonas meishanensis TaxID=2873264 RepID=UPI00223A8BB4|nr:DUF4249 domain-containing protein [[Muricauda] meishanensis]